MKLAKRDTRLFLGGQSRNVFFGFTILVGEMEALVDVTALCLEFLCEFHLYNDLQWLSCEFKVILLELNLMIPQCNT